MITTRVRFGLSFVLSSIVSCSGSTPGDNGQPTDGAADDGVPFGGCHLTMSHQSATTSFHAVTLDFAGSDFADLRCDLGAHVCTVDTHLGLGNDGMILDFTQPTSPTDSFQLSNSSGSHIELVQPSATTGDSWSSIAGRLNFSEVSATTGTSFTVVQAQMEPESVTGNDAQGTFELNMQCRGLMITNIQ